MAVDLEQVAAEEEYRRDEDERLQRLLHRDMDTYPYQQFGRCVKCDRVHSDETYVYTHRETGEERIVNKRLLVTGKSPESLTCFDCWRAKPEANEKRRHICQHGCGKDYASRAGLLRHLKDTHEGKERPDA